ncbi:MAG: OmpH family outer membrane protein [Fimbriiglobus sp.]|nr:OmpH family outer membrane protein [Fimbriiglobus sp.]
MKRVYLCLAAVVGLAVGGSAVAQAPPAGAPATAPTRTDSPRVAAFNVAMLMKSFNKWQYYAVVMENARIDAAIELMRMRNEIVTMQEALSKTTEVAKQNQMIDQIKEKQFSFEKQERAYKEKLDADAGKHLKELFADLNTVVKSVVEANGYDIVFAYPEATTKEEEESQNYIDLKLRATAAMPFFVSKRADITKVMVDTLNQYRPAPAAIPEKRKMPDMGSMGKPAVTPTGGLSAPAPGK